jgi:hypothetical protein
MEERKKKKSSVWQLLGVAKIQNGGRCHGNQGAKHVKFTPDSNNFCSNVSCHIELDKLLMEERKKKKNN